MPSYFRQVPNFDYVSRLPDAKISDYAPVKNLFKKGKLREDIFQDLSFFTKYKINGDDRPDNVAFEIYDDSSLDWLVLICNNIVNIQTEWPMTQVAFDEYLLSKYGTYETLYSGIHHYETSEVVNSQGVVIVPAGLEVSSPYSISFYDYFTDGQINTGNIAVPVTNYEYEEKKENDKRNIYLLKSQYLNIVLNDMNEIMPYKKGSSQYVSEDLKRGDNIRLYS
jgi:Base plate wedge protein 53